MVSNVEISELKAPLTITFKQIVAQLIKTGNKGTVCYCHKNASLTEDFKITTYKSALGISIEDEVILSNIQGMFDDGAGKVIFFEYKDSLNSAIVLEGLNALEIDWILADASADQENICRYAKEKKCFAVVFNIAADSMYVVNFVNPSVTLSNGTVKTGLEYLPKLAGVMAGCPYDKSVSYKKFDDLSSVKLPENTNYGEFILDAEDGEIRCVAPVNSLTTLGENKTEDMKSICIVEGMRRTEIDLRKAFKVYKGNYKNSYDNQCLFFSAILGYFDSLIELRILDGNYKNSVGVNIEKQRSKWIATGKAEAADWSIIEIKNNTFKNMVFPRLDVKYLDAIEGMEMEVEMF